MKAWILPALTGIEHMTFSNFPDPAPGPNQVLLAPKFAALNPADRYLAMLAAGGTKYHAELLKPFGLDARDPAFWQGGLSVIEGMIVELEGL